MFAKKRRSDSHISVIRCDHLVVATGKCSTPRRPATVLQNLLGFSGEVRGHWEEELLRRLICFALLRLFLMALVVVSGGGGTVT